MVRRPLTLTILMLLYAVFGAGIAVWVIQSPDELTLPEPVLWTAVAINAVLALGIWRRVRGTRWLAVLVHAIPTAAASTFAVLHVTGERIAAGEAPLLELAAKAGVHALLFVYWLRSRAVRAFFAGDQVAAGGAAGGDSTMRNAT